MRDNYAWANPAWQTAAYMMVRHAKRDLLKHACFQWRGLNYVTLNTFDIGFRHVAERPAITLPWYAQDGRLHAVRYRFTDGQEPRYGQKAGSYNLVFGMQNLRERHVLMLVEGEINAMSVWQNCGDYVDVLSFGSEAPASGVRRFMQEIASAYKMVYVWTDKPVSIGLGDYLITSSRDANDLLQAGELSDFLVSHNVYP